METFTSMFNGLLDRIRLRLRRLGTSWSDPFPIEVKGEGSHRVLIERQREENFALEKKLTVLKESWRGGAEVVLLSCDGGAVMRGRKLEVLVRGRN
ncbi:hypothetical protein CDL15_Pgr009263 [Punica granatum]|uniref:Uncharacterized protein n=1 Tax=Punica granatum TaxID=22663 RepID=A0A218WW39_PUNGR|nr:hypothetical protein CDL15_Pgr009263 [Punica granatum]